MYKDFVEHVKKVFNTSDFIPLHEPRFIGNERKYVADCIDSTFVSSVGKYVDMFEEMIAEFTGAKYAVATVNGTAALHIALLMAGVKADDEIITQPLTFIATANAISYCNAHPVFVDVELDTMGMSPEKLSDFLQKNCEQKSDGYCYNKLTKRKLAACVPMHTYGHPCRIDEIAKICQQYNIELVEDAAESIGSLYKNKHTGTFGKFGVLSFNGNKTITTGGGGMVITDDPKLAKKAKHITTTGKVPHRWEYVHDLVAYNYRMPNINAALGCAQMENLKMFIENKRALFQSYKEFFNGKTISVFEEPEHSYSNYWLNVAILSNNDEREAFLQYTNDNGVMTRPIWQLMNKTSMYKNAQCGSLENSEWLEDRVVNIPSSVRV